MKSKIWDLEKKSFITDLKFDPKPESDPSENIQNPTAV